MLFMNKIRAALSLPAHALCTEVLHSSYTMCNCGSPDMYILGLPVYVIREPLMPMV